MHNLIIVSMFYLPNVEHAFLFIRVRNYIFVKFTKMEHKIILQFYSSLKNEYSLMVHKILNP